MLQPPAHHAWSRPARKDPHLELHNVGVLPTLTEVQQLAAQHRLAVLAPRNEPAQQRDQAI
jgi:hypothetical protein